MDEAGQQLRVDLALIHFPVINRNNETIGSAVTNLDIHDIARAGCTYGIDNYYIVTPYADQQQLVDDILDYWRVGFGASYNEHRKQALAMVRLCENIAGLYAEVTAKWQQRPTVLATSAAGGDLAVKYEDVRRRIFSGEPFLILFGTGWGMAPEIMAEVDGLLPPLKGMGNYNHLSVRSAVSIIMDRLLGDRHQ